MQDGTILLWKSKGFIGWCIKKITGMPWGHSATYLKGFTLESTAWWSGYWWKSGIRVSAGLSAAHEYWQLKEPITPAQVDRELAYWLDKLNKRLPYNIPKLVVLALVIPCRRFFDRIGWIPFDNPRFGDVCSVSCAEGKEAAGLKVLPKVPAGRAAPGDFRKSPLLERVEE